jgi:hypothetical protein
MPRAALLLLMVVLGVVVDATPARACAACACGSTAALPVGTELPFAGRVRTSVSLQAATTTTTDSTGAVTVTALGLPVTAMVAVHEALTLDVTVPLGLRLRADAQHGVDGRGVGVGDVVVGARAVWRDRPFAPRLVLGARVGAMLPTTTVLRRADGAPMASALQPGTAGLAPVLELSGAWFVGDVVVVATASGLAPLWSRLDEVEAASAQARAFTLWRLDERLTLRGGLIARATGPGDSAHRDDRRVGVGPEVGVIVDVVTDVAVAATASVPLPVVGGAVVEGGRAELTLLVDW